MLGIKLIPISPALFWSFLSWLQSVLSSITLLGEYSDILGYKEQNPQFNLTRTPNSFPPNKTIFQPMVLDSNILPRVQQSVAAQTAAVKTVSQCPACSLSLWCQTTPCLIPSGIPEKRNSCFLRPGLEGEVRDQFYLVTWCCGLNQKYPYQPMF